MFEDDMAMRIGWVERAGGELSTLIRRSFSGQKINYPLRSR